MSVCQYLTRWVGGGGRSKSSHETISVQKTPTTLGKARRLKQFEPTPKALYRWAKVAHTVPCPDGQRVLFIVQRGLWVSEMRLVGYNHAHCPAESSHHSLRWSCDSCGVRALVTQSYFLHLCSYRVAKHGHSPFPHLSNLSLFLCSLSLSLSLLSLIHI